MTDALNAASNEIYVVDDDASIREMLAIVLSSEGYKVACFADGPSLLAVARERVPACILLDIQIPGMTGLDILGELQAKTYPAPVFIISGKGDIPTAVEAIRRGARDFIEKPFRGREFVLRLRTAIDARKSRLAKLAGGEALTHRQHQVLDQWVLGATSKESSRILGLSPRTIEDHRANIMRKLGTRNSADTVRLAMAASTAESP